MERTPVATSGMARFVLDCSVVFSWFFADESNDYADSIARILSTAMVIVPDIWPLEVANTLLVGQRRKRNTESEAAGFLHRLSVLPIELDGQTAAHAWSKTIALARMYSLSAYDAAYLELAMRHRVPLATLDEELKKAATAAGIAIFR